MRVVVCASMHKAGRRRQAGRLRQALGWRCRRRKRSALQQRSLQLASYMLQTISAA